MSETEPKATGDAAGMVSPGDLARYSGDLHGRIMQMGAEMSKMSAQQLLQRAEADLIRLHDAALITTSELASLRDVLSTIGTAETPPAERLNRVDAIHRTLGTNSASPCAVVVASIAVDSSRRLAERSASTDASVHSTSDILTTLADVAGGVGGVYVGDEMCGTLCAIMGGIAGAAGLSMLTQEALE